jgi:ApaG protein
MANETTAHQISSDTTTEGIRIQVFPDYMPEHSSPEQNRFTFSYKVIITNESEAKVKLLSRHWVIINSDGDPEKVDGPGVVGYTPDLEPGESFEYGSQTPLNTGWGTMEGSYTMMRENGQKFEAKIGRFYLVSDEVLA